MPPRSFVLVTGATVFCTLALVACSRPKTTQEKRAAQTPKDRADAVAEVDDDVVITVGELQRRLNDQPVATRQRYASPEKKREFLEGMLRVEVLAKEAQRRNLDKDPALQGMIKQFMIQSLLKEELSKLRADDITDQRCKEYFDSHLSEFNQPEQVQCSWILTKDLATAKKVLADPRIKGLSDEKYWKLVGEYSEDEATKNRGGQLPVFDDGNKTLPKEVVEAAFNLEKPGDVTAPIKTSHGVAIVKLLSRTKGITHGFDDVKQEIRRRLFANQQQEHMKAFEKRVRDKSNVKINEARLAGVVLHGVD